MEDSLIFERETLIIEGDRNLYSYSFRESTPQDRLIAMIEGGEIGVVGAFLEGHPDLDLSDALAVARELQNGEAISEIEKRLP